MTQEINGGDLPPDASNPNSNDEILMADLVEEVGSEAVEVWTHSDESASWGVGEEAIRDSLIERVLSPESLQRMMMIGGGMLSIGFAIWLWSIGVFNNAWILATAFGAANVACLAGGAWLFKKTKLTTAGLGLIMLSCLVMPLNLWLYHSQELIVLGSGGQLWIPALIIAVVYAGIARLTRNRFFVYTLVAGIVMTGLLFLAGVPANLFWAALPTSTFLVAVGAIAIQADRWFGEKEGAFSRNQFGIACFRSGMVTLIAGLGVLLAGQLLALVPNYLVQESARDALMALTLAKGKLWALAILGGAGYSCVHAMMYGRNGWFVKAILTVVGFWFITQLLYLLEIQLTLDIAILIVVGGVFGARAWSLLIGNTIVALLSGGEGHLAKTTASTSRLKTPVGTSVAMEVSSTSCLLAMFGVAVFRSLYELVQTGTLFVNWQHVVAVSLVAAGSILSPVIWREPKDSSAGYVQFLLSFAGGAVGLAVAIVLAEVQWLDAVESIVVMASAALLGAASVFGLQKSKTSESLAWLMSGLGWGVASIALAYASLGAFSIWATVSGCMTAILLAAVWLLVGTKNSSLSERCAGAIAACLATAQWMTLAGLTGPYAVILMGSVIGWGGVIVCRLISVRISIRTTEAKAQRRDSLVVSAFNALVLIGATAAVLFVAFSLDQKTGQWGHVALLVAQAVGLAISALFVGPGDWRKSYLAGIPIVLLTSLIVWVAAAELTRGQQIEICCLFAGGLVTVGAYIGWANENDEPNDATTVSFWIGTLLLVVPMLIGLLLSRIDGGDVMFSWRGFHEVGGLLVGLVLLGSGILCRVRSTTLGGGVMLVTWLLSHLLVIHWPGELRNASVLMMVGGGSFFAIAVLLSIYRDRILQIPDRVRTGKGVFGVMKWR